MGIKYLGTAWTNWLLKGDVSACIVPLSAIGVKTMPPTTAFLSFFE